MNNCKETAEKVIRNIAEKTDECALFLSLGKDSLVCLDMIYPHFRRIVCVYMYFVKDLEHINRWINWVKAKYPKVEFVQVPHWNLTYILRAGLFCTAHKEVKLMKLRNVINSINLQYGTKYTFLGMKKADGMNRRLMLLGYEQQCYENAGLVYPLADFTQKDVLAYMKQHNLPTPVRYGKSASSGCGFGLDFFLWLREKFPQDLKKVYAAFPLSEKILFDYDSKNK
ncbi:MAG: phosphoadenosine phosphosulfate reductase family protein [Bacteroidales bacterium]|nr:phosphoadenosine phosphosulfate reductase family protein [Bacteroidales bacterium]MBO7617369.1 phosphoadenosine phosphosulfate reductase family protein [Bacteroidales bacterium]